MRFSDENDDQQQVKIQGHEIDFGKIESVLVQHLAVSAAVVTTVGEPDRNQHLVAYIVPASENASVLFEMEGQDTSKMQKLWQSLVNVGCQKAQQPPESGIDLQIFSSLSQQMEHLSIAYICHTLNKLGVYIQSQERYSTDDLINHCQIQPFYKKLLRQWLRALKKYGLLQQEGEDTFINLHPLPTNSLDPLWQQIEQYKNLMPQASIPHLENNFHYLQKSAENHVAMLKGELDPLELFFAKGSLDTADSAYQFNPISNYYNSIAREIVGSVLKDWQPGRPLRILEIGAGTGATTASLLPILPPNQIVYTFTDVSNFFMASAKKKFRNYPFVEYRQLDIEQDPQIQGYQLGSFDVIVAANVLHIASNLPQTLQYIRSLLAANGLLLMIELTQYNPTVMTTMGFVHGFSKFADERLETNIPVLSVGKWYELLFSHEFENIVAFPEAGAATEFMAQNVIVAQASANIKRFKPYELHNFLKTKLPEYMVPSIYRLLDTLPLNNNGEVDRQALSTIQQVKNFSQEKTELLFQQANNRAQKRKEAAKQKQRRQHHE